MSLIILDRDGVINFDSESHIKSADEWVPIPGSLEAIARLSQNGYRVVIASNQSGIAQGLFDVDGLSAIHAKMDDALAPLGGRVEATFFSPAGPRSRSRCRKPKPGLFEDIARRLQVSLAGVPAVGDAMRDVHAAQAAGARAILVRTGNGSETLDSGKLAPEVAVFDDLAAVADALLAGTL